MYVGASPAPPVDHACELTELGVGRGHRGTADRDRRPAQGASRGLRGGSSRAAPQAEARSASSSRAVRMPRSAMPPRAPRGSRREARRHVRRRSPRPSRGRRSARRPPLHAAAPDQVTIVDGSRSRPSSARVLDLDAVLRPDALRHAPRRPSVQAAPTRRGSSASWSRQRRPPRRRTLRAHPRRALRRTWTTKSHLERASSPSSGATGFATADEHPHRGLRGRRVWRGARPIVGA